MKKGQIVFLILFLIVAAVSFSSVYRVDEKQRAVKLRLGAMVQAEINPGLHFKIPFVDDIRVFDARVQTVDARPESFFTVNKKRLTVDSFVKYRIADIGTYYRATGGDEKAAQQRLAARVNDGLRNEFGVRTLLEVVSGERDQLLTELTAQLDITGRETLGIQVLDIRVKQVDLPNEIRNATHKRMRAEREKLSRKSRSQGKEEATKIEADADRQKVLIEAEAYRQSEEIRGLGDATAAKIYADAYNKDPEFYRFVRSLEAYKKSFSNKDDLMLIDSKSDFFDYLNQSKGK